MQKIFLIVLFFILAVFFTPTTVFAQTLSLDPTQIGVTVGQEFTVKININTNGVQTSGADAMITFDSNVLDLTNTANGGFYTTFAANPLSGATNKYYINAFETDSTSTKTGSGTIATLTFKGKANGSSPVTFDCTAGSKADTNIIKSGTSDDVVNCSGLVTGSYTVGPANATPITSNTSSNPTPSVLPRSGSVEVTLLAVGAGILLTLVGLVFKM